MSQVVIVLQLSINFSAEMYLATLEGAVCLKKVQWSIFFIIIFGKRRSHGHLFWVLVSKFSSTEPRKVIIFSLSYVLWSVRNLYPWLCNCREKLRNVCKLCTSSFVMFVNWTQVASIDFSCRSFFFLHVVRRWGYFFNIAINTTAALRLLVWPVKCLHIPFFQHCYAHDSRLRLRVRPRRPVECMHIPGHQISWGRSVKKEKISWGKGMQYAHIWPADHGVSWLNLLHPCMHAQARPPFSLTRQTYWQVVYSTVVFCFPWHCSYVNFG